MPSDIQHRPPPLVTLSGALISYVHTICGFLAFGCALLIAIGLHYHKVVKNGIAGWPEEYWPSVSATIGDWYPERNLFQIGIALMSGPRFILVFLSSMLVSLSKPDSWHARILLLVGILRTFACGGWVYVTSSDDHDIHDIMMGAYLILTPPWMFITSGSLAAQPNKEMLMSTSKNKQDALADKARKTRRLAASAFFGMIPFMVFFFYRHKVLEIHGAYTHYAFFEWGLIVFDLLYDYASIYDLSRLEIQVVEAKTSAVMSSDGKEKSQMMGGTWLLGGTHEAVSTGSWSTSPNSSVYEKKGRTTKRNQPKKSLTEESKSSLLSDSLDFLAEAYLSFLFWTCLTGLHAEIFYFSVYNMGVGGHEALLVIQVIALLVASLPPIRSLFFGDRPSTRLTKNSVDTQGAHIGRHRMGVMIAVYVLCLSGFAIWPFDDALARLIATALSCSGFTFLTVLEWGRAWETDDVGKKAIVWVTGLLLTSVSKYTNHSNNPAWSFLNPTNGGQNGIALLLAIAAVAQRLSNLQAQHKAKFEPFKPRKGGNFSDVIVSACSLGAYIFGLHVLLSDSGSMIAWTWTGYPIKGPMAITHGRYILLASCVSLLIALRKPELSVQPLFWLFGCLSIFITWACEDWTGFIGTIGAAAFLPIIGLPLLQSAMKHHPLKIMLGAWFVADFMAFLQVLTAAYAFVPGGQIMREHTGAMMFIMMVFLLLGLWKARAQNSLPKTVTKRTRSIATIVLGLIAIFAQFVPLIRYVQPHSIQPYHPTDRVFAAGIWTIHFGLDQSMWESSRRIASLVEDVQLDVIGLLESDTHRTVFGNRDLTQYLAEKLNMYADIGPGPDKHTWGAALLSKFPIVNSTHHLLPSPNGELAPAIHAVLDVFGVPTHVVVSHNGQEEDPLDRELQTTELARILSEAYPHPAVFLGYVVTKPHAPRPNPYEILFKDGRIHDVHPKDEDRWCQYIGFRALERVAYVRVSRYTVTDTELQTAKFRVPLPGQPPIDPDRDVLPFHTMISPDEKAWAYPKKFIDPPAMVFDKHKYSPWYWPWYYYAEEVAQLQL